MTTKSKWFVVATEGATTDGRKINREWLNQIAKNYDPKNRYGARINLEHFKSWWFDKDFAHSYSYGDVLSVKVEEREDGKLQLLAEISPTEALVKLVKEKQKVYTSVEIDLDFADTGEAYLVGLAVTDTPASLGTEYLTFCAGAKQNPLTDRKQKPENLVGEAVEANLEFAEEAIPFFERFKAMFTKAKTDNDGKFTEHEKAMELLAEQFSNLQTENNGLKKELETVKGEFAEVKKQAVDFAQKFAELEKQDSQSYTPRPQATGGKNKDYQTDF
ncbi:capsule biosynthesis protein CapA [Mannheimia granulomatis]|uniref:Capsule biosynthesis protein CapA n=1 Tax=Mannheimia granulomatis TaxID=85402 RepID=A0A011P5A8_9PAST|nr:GPO family capsid scaffolding protein [Mannheimia granulomatis]EXI61684.1 capsule biosynthesis protein CapA [Mannheimia granulomatis]RGE48261.1 capsule biosynthesis protein CapA [Mannheimia granulomatis]